MYSQQDQHFTMYMQNPFAYNPSIAGTYDHYQIRSNHRFQYLGFKDAPVTNEISFYGPDSKRPMGYGASVYSDMTGPISRIGANGVYAYNTKITKDIFISGGLGLGFIQYKIDGTKITKLDVNDPALESRVYSSFVPDASMGVYVWNTDFYGGFSIQHMLHSKITISDINDQNRLNLHYYLVGGYRRDISGGRKAKVWVIEPSVIVKKVVPASWQL
jgi:type IX secretion system PorP/SprF family membrane protein